MLCINKRLYWFHGSDGCGRRNRPNGPDRRKRHYRPDRRNGRYRRDGRNGRNGRYRRDGRNGRHGRDGPDRPLCRFNGLCLCRADAQYTPAAHRPVPDG